MRIVMIIINISRSTILEVLLLTERNAKLGQTLIKQYMNQNINCIRNKGYVDNMKNYSNIRILINRKF